ncbi:MAG: hypothetical protein HC879_08395 [Leptolyngbyaceae cyanobacterium SL_5_9]|nr:hypothetical protein [Leptolyngbyaceae cyanobacterium SL_5_9]
MNKRPSNTILYAVVAVIGLFAFYIVGNLLLKARREVREEAFNLPYPSVQVSQVQVSQVQMD